MGICILILLAFAPLAFNGYHHIPEPIVVYEYEPDTIQHDCMQFNCEPFCEPIVGYVYFYVSHPPYKVYFRYLQDGPRHFRAPSRYDDFEVWSDKVNVYPATPPSLWERARRVDGMVAVIGRNGNEGWIFANELNPFWYPPSLFERDARRNFVSDDELVARRQARDDFVKEYGNMICINVYDFDGVTVVDVWLQDI